MASRFDSDHGYDPSQSGEQHESHSSYSQWLGEVDASVRTFVAERPIAALCGAMGLGFVIGRLLRR